MGLRLSSRSGEQPDNVDIGENEFGEVNRIHQATRRGKTDENGEEGLLDYPHSPTVTESLCAHSQTHTAARHSVTAHSLPDQRTEPLTNAHTHQSCFCNRLFRSQYLLLTLFCVVSQVS